jgi:hypothetical protein
MGRVGGLLAVCLLILAGCVGAPTPTVAPERAARTALPVIDTSGSFAKGFSRDEALSLLELCLNLNNPDDGPAYAADTSAWDPIYPDAANKPADVLGPWNNAWKLWRSKTEPNTYAVVIRGTMADETSIIEDVIATSVAQPTRMQAWQNGYLDFTLARFPGAETHLGFTYGLAALLFAQDKGILAQLAQRVPQGSKIYITGHSQGAAIATLLHAFLHYAINDPTDRYHLAKLNYSLKSYFFAQPKPGNWQFAMDFAGIASSHGTSFAVNNALDWVTQVPLAIELLDEPGGDLMVQLNQNAQARGKVVEFEALKIALYGVEAAVKGAKAARARFAASTEHDTLTPLQQATGLLDTQWMKPGQAVVLPAVSINYVGAGNLVPVFGSTPCVPLAPLGPSGDPLCQHHLPTYRALMKAQLNPTGSNTAGY